MSPPLLPDQPTRATERLRLTIRPWVTIVKDKGTGVVVGIHVSEEKTRTYDVVGVFAAAMTSQTALGGTVIIGGRPESVLCDNGAENLGQVFVNGMAHLGVAILPTTPGHSWQNGSAENINRLYQRECEAGLPGYVKGGKGVDGGLRFTANTYDEEDPDGLITVEALYAKAQEWAAAYNQTPGSDGRSPLQRWVDDDDTPIVEVNDDEVTFAMSVADRKSVVTKNGIHFRTREYQAAFTADYVGRGKALTIRYLPGVTDWIDCYDADGNWVGRAYLKALLPRSEQTALIRARQAITNQVRTAEQQSVRMRQAEAAGDSEDEPISARDRRDPHHRKRQQRKDKGNRYGGGAQSARDAKRMADHQAAAIARFGDLDLPLTPSAEDGESL